MFCEVCNDSDGCPVYECNNCRLIVHSFCYGIIHSDSGRNWKCAFCLSGEDKALKKCVLCVRRHGAFKRTTDKKWVHVVCALFIEGCVFEDKDTMEPIDTSGVKNWKQSCAFCSKTNVDEQLFGATAKCAKPKCNKFVHATCAQKQNLNVEFVTKKETLHFDAFCSKEHLDAVENRRHITRMSVRDYAKSPKKLGKDALKKIATQDNTNWLKNSKTRNTNNGETGDKTGKQADGKTGIDSGIVTREKTDFHDSDDKENKQNDKQHQNKRSMDKVVLKWNTEGKASRFFKNKRKKNPYVMRLSESIAFILNLENTNISKVYSDSSEGRANHKQLKQSQESANLQDYQLKDCLHWLNILNKEGVDGIKNCRKCVQYELEIQSLRLMNYNLQTQSSINEHNKIKRKSGQEIDNPEKKTRIHKEINTSMGNKSVINTSGLPEPVQELVSTSSQKI